MADDEVRTEMHRLKRWIGKERARAARIEKSAYERGDGCGRERAYGEHAVLSMVMAKIDERLRQRASEQGGTENG